MGSLAVSAGRPVQAAAPVDPFLLSPEQLFDATVVSVSKTSETVKDAPAAVYVLTGEDIKRSGATSIPEALRLVPGVQVARVNASGWAISVRGFNNPLANKLLVLIDGREVYDALFAGVYWDVQDMPLEDIERIEVVRGPGGTLWGANAVNGVINIITKKASDTRGALVSTVVGDQDKAIVTTRYGADTSDNAHWRIYGKFLDRDHQETPTGADAMDGWTSWRSGFRGDWDPNSHNDTFTVQGDLYQSSEGQIRSVPTLTPPYAVATPDHVPIYGGNLLGRWSRELGDDSRFSVQSYIDVVDRRTLVLGDHRTTLDFDAQYELPQLDRNKVIVGVFYRNTLESLTGTPLITFAKSDLDDNLFSGFVQDKVTLDPGRWFFTLGSKFEHNDNSGFEWQPSGRLQWQDDTQMAWAAVSRAVRTPTPLEQDLDILSGVLPPSSTIPLPVSVELKPSPNFGSEKLIAYEFGYRRQWSGSVQTDVSVFYNDYDELSTLTLLPPGIGLNPLHFILPIATTNLTSGHTYGGEAVIDWRAAESLNFSATYGFLVMNLAGPPSNQAIASTAAMGQSPRNQINLRSQWDVTDTVSFDTTLGYTDALPGFAIHAYWRLDARIGWRLSDKLEFDLVGQNLTSSSHREWGAATAADSTIVGRSFYGKLTWRP